MESVLKIEVETKRLQNDIDSLRGHLQRIRQTREKIMAGMEAMGAMWEGEAKNALTAQFKADYENLKAMENIIETLIGDLEFAKERYNSCESSIASAINLIRV